VIAPGLQMVSDELAARLTAFVAAGGTLILDQKAGTRDQAGLERPLNGPAVFHAVAGLTIESTTRVDTELPAYALQFADGQTRYPVLRNLEKVDLASAKVLAWVRRPDLQDIPAITVNQAGEGRVVYFAASSIAPAFYQDAFQRIGSMLRMAPILKVPTGVEVVSRDSRGVEYLFLQNTLAASQRVRLERDYRDALTREPVRGELELSGFEVRVLHR
jgi:beta-galactosidase